ncbi:MAG: TonB family protein [Bacteroidetes bacterium]|nr:TonB family protein [Bacteroidota bacterium]
MGNLEDNIIKYKKGELSSKEMHALEKKALNDPFLAEALEGLQNISETDLVDDVKELNQKLLKDKKTALFTPLRIAAGVILVMASVFVFYQLKPKHETIALKAEKNILPSSPKTEAQKPVEKTEAKDNVATKSNLGEVEKLKPEKAKTELAMTENEKLKAADHERISATAKPKIETQPTVAEHKEIGPEKKSDEAKGEVLDQAPVAVAMEPVKEVTEQQDLKNDSRAVGRTKKAKYKSEAMSGAGLAGRTQINLKPISGKVISAEDGQPLSGVNVVIEGTAQGTVTDSNGNFTLQIPNENQRLAFSFIGLQTKEIEVKGKDKMDVEMNADVTQLSEVVVTGLGIARDDNEEPVIHLANPFGGRKAYDKYLETNVHYPDEALKNNIKGKVRVEFAVHPDGSFDEYKVVKSLGYGCDEEVIRLIKEGPKWSPTTENGQPVESKVRIGVKFDPAKSGR